MERSFSAGVKKAIDIFGSEFVRELDEVFTKVEQMGLKKKNVVQVKFDCGVQSLGLVMWKEKGLYMMFASEMA